MEVQIVQSLRSVQAVQKVGVDVNNVAVTKMDSERFEGLSVNGISQSPRISFRSS
jgi:hypothetical protein